MDKIKVCEMCNYYYDKTYINPDYLDFCENCSRTQKRFDEKYTQCNYINFLKYEIKRAHDKINWYIKQYSPKGAGCDINYEKDISEYNILINLYQQEINTLTHLNAYGKNIDRKELKKKAREIKRY